MKTTIRALLIAGIDAAAACVACHGEAGADVMPQPPVYTGKQRLTGPAI